MSQTRGKRLEAIYAICRLWGVVPAMACPFGCQPDRWLSDREACLLLAEMRAIGGPNVEPDLVTIANKLEVAVDAVRDPRSST
jgi:hypothetical protein